MEYEYERELQIQQPELSVGSDAERQAYEDLANSESTTVAVVYSQGKTYYHVRGRCLDLRKVRRKSQYLELYPVGNVDCVSVVEDYLYGTCRYGAVEFDVIRGTCFRIEKDDPRLMKDETNLLFDPFKVVRVKWEDKRIATADQYHTLLAVTDQKVGTDALRQGIQAVAAGVKLKVYRDKTHGVGANDCSLHLMDLLQFETAASE